MAAEPPAGQRYGEFTRSYTQLRRSPSELAYFARKILPPALLAAAPSPPQPRAASPPPPPRRLAPLGVKADAVAGPRRPSSLPSSPTMQRGGGVERPAAAEASAVAAATDDARIEQKSERKLERSARGVGQRSHPTLPACAIPSAAARVAELERLEERIAYLKVHEMAARRRGKVKLSNSILIELSGLETRRFKLLKNMERQLRSAAEFQAASELWRRGLLNESREARIRAEEERNIVENARLMVG